MRSHILLGVIALLCLTQTFAGQPRSFKLESARNLQGYYAQPGTFNLVEAQAGIVTQNPGVFVNVYFDRNLDGGSGQLEFNVKGGTLMLSLYSSTTVLANECLGFKKYDCAAFGCQTFSDETDTMTFTNFTSTGHYANSTVYIDKNYWDLSTKSFVMDDCDTLKVRNNVYGTGVTGIVGMGISGDALKNFVMNQTYDSIMGGSEQEQRTGNPRFAIFMNADGKSGTLMFDFDSTKTLTSNPIYTLSADADWHVAGVTGVQVADKSFDLPTNLIFDINSDTLGLPMGIYTEVVKAINDSVDGISCPTDEVYRPKCKYTGKIELLPDIKIVVNGQAITVPASAYAEVEEKIDIKPDSIFLHLKGLSSTTDDQSNYITPGFENYVILGQRVMGYYYIFFDSTAQADGSFPITMYVSNHGSSSKALVTILICTVIGLIVGLSIYRYKKIKKARMAANPPLLQTRMGDQELNLLQGQRR